MSDTINYNAIGRLGKGEIAFSFPIALAAIPCDLSEVDPHERS